MEDIKIKLENLVMDAASGSTHNSVPLPTLLGFQDGKWTNQPNPPNIIANNAWARFTETNVKQMLNTIRSNVNPYTAVGLDFVLQKEMKARIKTANRERTRLMKLDANILKIFLDIEALAGHVRNVPAVIVTPGPQGGTDFRVCPPGFSAQGQHQHEAMLEGPQGGREEWTYTQQNDAYLGTMGTQPQGF